jgi:5-formyltetrahydrofolate cyclo-ligase
VSARAGKARIRKRIWDRLQEDGVARFPFPPHGRIPNFAGAREAAERLLSHPRMANVRRMKVNPDAPQRPLREVALRAGIVLYVPTPRLRGGFFRFDPRKIPPSKLRDAASLSRGRAWAEPVPLERLPRMDWIIAGSVAVTRDGRRCGKGEGYSDLEYAILRELGHPPAPVATTVHPLQIVRSMPRERSDLPVHLVVTANEVIEIREPPPAPRGIDWSLLSERDLRVMPVLAELATRRRRR